MHPSNVPELVTMARGAHDARTPLRVVGGGSWLHAGGTVRADAERLELSGLAGVLEYVPGDLTLTARAGTTLAEIDAATAPHGQWCPLLPWGGDEATLGAVFATATGGPCAKALGRPRDLALGLEFVDGTGTLVRAGGRVVKNVAGFDLTRLLVGSWGTLGAITELSVRLRARPKVDETWVLSREPGDAAAAARIDAFERGPHAPLALQRVDAAQCGLLGLEPRDVALVRIGGNASFVASSRAALREVGDVRPCDTAIWTRCRALATDDPRLETAHALSDALSRRVKQKFDPRHILNPGIFGEVSA